jgi:hypothetical protein
LIFLVDFETKILDVTGNSSAVELLAAERKIKYNRRIDDDDRRTTTRTSKIENKKKKIML